MSANSEDLSLSSFVTAKCNSGSYSIGFTSIASGEDGDETKIEKQPSKEKVREHGDGNIINGRRGIFTDGDEARKSCESESDSEDCSTDDFSPNQSPFKKYISVSEID